MFLIFSGRLEILTLTVFCDTESSRLIARLHVDNYRHEFHHTDNFFLKPVDSEFGQYFSDLVTRTLLMLEIQTPRYGFYMNRPTRLVID